MWVWHLLIECAINVAYDNCQVLHLPANVACCVIVYGPISTLHNKLAFKFGITWSNWQSLWQTETEKHLTSSSRPFEHCVARRRETQRKRMTGHQGTITERQGKWSNSITTITTTATIHSFNFPSTTRFQRDPHCPCWFFVCTEIQRLENSYISLSDVCDVAFLRPAQLPFGIMHMPLRRQQLRSSIKLA